MIALHLDISENVVLDHAELVHLHQFENGQEGDDDFSLGGG